jgi:hypothetical protein
MEKTRTLYRLRKFKNSITLAGIALLFGVFLFAGTNIFHKQLNSFLREKSTNVLQEQYQDNINNALCATNESISLIEKSALLAIMFSVEAFIIIFIYVRMSHKTSKFSKSAPLVLSIGVIALCTYYLIIGLLLPSTGQLAVLRSNYSILNIFGSSLILFANVIFVYQVFIQVVLERIED